MAEIVIRASEVRLALTAAEKIEGVHGDLVAPLSALRRVEVLDDAHDSAGIKAGMKVGTRIPGLVEVGRIVGAHTQRFAAVHHATPRGVRLTFEGQGIGEWIVGCEDPEGTAARIEDARDARPASG